MHIRLSLASQLHFQDCAYHLWLYFHSQVNTNMLSKCTPKNVLPKCTVKFISKASPLLTSSHLGQACHCGTSLFVVQYTRSCQLDTATLPRVLYVERPLWARFARGAVSHSRPAQRCHTRNSNSLLSCLWSKCPAQLSSSLPTATIYCLSSFLPSPQGTSVFWNLLYKKKINNLFLCVLSSVPVVHLPLTCLGSSEVCHRIGSLAVSSSPDGEVGDLPKVVSSSYKSSWWPHHLSGLWSPLLCCKQTENCLRYKCSLAIISHTAEEIPLDRHCYLVAQHGIHDTL